MTEQNMDRRAYRRGPERCKTRRDGRSRRGSGNHRNRCQRIGSRRCSQGGRAQHCEGDCRRRAGRRGGDRDEHVHPTWPCPTRGFRFRGVDRDDEAKTSKRHEPPPQQALPESEPEVVRAPATAPVSPPVRSKTTARTARRNAYPRQPKKRHCVPALPPPPADTAPSPDRVSSLAREIALLDASRASLARGDARGRVEASRSHAQEFAHGNFGPEAVVMRIEALLRLGDERPPELLPRSLPLTIPTTATLPASNRCSPTARTNRRPTMIPRISQTASRDARSYRMRRKHGDASR